MGPVNVKSVPVVSEVDDSVRASAVVTELKVKAVVFPAMAIERLPVGAVRVDQAVEVPLQAVNDGAAPLAEVKHKVPAPPVAVWERTPDEFA